jgi:hypothetical protein
MLLVIVNTDLQTLGHTIQAQPSYNSTADRGDGVLESGSSVLEYRNVVLGLVLEYPWAQTRPMFPCPDMGIFSKGHVLMALGMGIFWLPNNVNVLNI